MRNIPQNGIRHLILFLRDRSSHSKTHKQYRLKDCGKYIRYYLCPYKAIHL